jgi:exopolysaccharide production protein ExoQ
MPRRIRLEGLLPVVLGATVFSFACGSSSVVRVQEAAKPTRWALLFLLLALAAVAVARDQRRLRLPASVVAATLALGGLALVSTLWSVAPRTSFEKAGTLVVLFLTVGLLAQLGIADRLVAGIVGGAAAVALAGLLVLAFRHADAVEAATRDLPARYEGLGQNPNTVPLLLAPCLALTVWLFGRTHSTRRRIGLAAAALLFDGSMIASGSRGSLIAAFAGVAVVVLLLPMRVRVRALLVACAAAMLAASIGIALVPKSKGAAWRPPHSVPAAAPGSHPNPGYTNVEGAFPLDSDIGSLLIDSKPSRRTLFGLTGRGEAWRGAIDLGNERPIVGYAFGTEGLVFVDRWADFVGGLPENSYIGLYLQLGVVGLLALAALVAAIGRAALWRPDRWEVAGPLGAFTAALILGLVQSYLYSVGNIATLALWTAAFVAAAQALPRREPV